MFLPCQQNKYKDFKLPTPLLLILANTGPTALTVSSQQELASRKIRSEET